MAPGLGTTPDHKVRLCDPLQARMVSLRERTAATLPRPAIRVFSLLISPLHAW